jgi:hypothetical protein
MRHLFLSSLRTTLEALQRLIRQRWSMGTAWHWAREAQLAVDGHRCANRTGAALVSFRRTIVMNLLNKEGFRSIRQGLREMADDIRWHADVGKRRVGAEQGLMIAALSSSGLDLIFPLASHQELGMHQSSVPRLKPRLW